MELQPRNQPDGRVFLFGKLKMQPPRLIAIRIGSIVNEMRASLDALACVLAERNGKTSTDVSFPIARESEWYLTRGKDRIRKLSEADQDRIGELQPFASGNSELVLLNDADNHRKHIQLLAVSGQGVGISILSGQFDSEGMQGYSPALSTKNYAHLMTVSGNSSASLQIRPGVQFDGDRPQGLKGHMVGPLLEKLLRATRDVVSEFE